MGHYTMASISIWSGAGVWEFCHNLPLRVMSFCSKLIVLFYLGFILYLRRLTQNYLSVVKYYLWNCEFVISLQDSSFFQNYDLNLREGILGDGSFSVCRKCTNRQTGEEFAVKIVSRKIDCTREINLLRACQGHRNIVNLHEVYSDEVSLHRLPFAFNVH